MMDIQEYIDSGVLELYVYGKLNAAEVAEVQKNAQQYEQVDEEIQAIEQVLIVLSVSVAPNLSVKNYEFIKNNVLNSDTFHTQKEFVDSKPTPSKNDLILKFLGYLGWITAISLSFLFCYNYDLLKKDAHQKQQAFELEKTNLDNKYLEVKLKNEEAEYLISVIRDTSNTVIPLQGQDVAPKAFAKIFWNRKNKTVYIDALGLPNPPFGMVYQVWSFKLNPLTPTNLGVMDTYKKDGRKFFKVNPSDEIDAFGISLEPAGGNETPTLEQLFALGKV